MRSIYQSACFSALVLALAGGLASGQIRSDQAAPQ